ncbi:DUF6251 family protein [Streptomyces sp. NBC_00683]|uniref:DUF6251 family protein n=1 Tax=Streptomyces sp. NBC_00683 TaxID=2903670 RepID=UPI003FA76BAA
MLDRPFAPLARLQPQLDVQSPHAPTLAAVPVPQIVDQYVHQAPPDRTVKRLGPSGSA